MSTYTNYISDPKCVVFGNDTVAITLVLETIRGGRTLNVDNYTEEVIHSGTPILVNAAGDTFIPMPVVGDGSGFAAKPSGYEYVGILIATISKNKPEAGILVRGGVNPNAAFYPTTALVAELKTALPLITFKAD